MAAVVLGRPGRIGVERWVHRRRSHCRCQRTTVSGRTTISVVRQSGQAWASSTQNSRSRWRSWGRRAVRLNTTNYWRSARFSSATARCPPQISATDRSTTTSAASMSYPVAQPTTQSTSLVGDLILATLVRCGHLSDEDARSANGWADGCPVGVSNVGAIAGGARESRQLTRPVESSRSTTPRRSPLE